MKRSSNGCSMQFNRAKCALSEGRLNDALAGFQDSLEACPVNHTADLHRICYFLGIAFVRMGMASCAVRSWEAGIQVRKNGYARKLKARFVNEYGMPRIGSSEDDDWQVFYSIHVKRYLSGKRTERLGSVAEKDMIGDLIRDAWNSLISGIKLHTMSPKQKLSLFRQVEIIFPFFEVPTGAMQNGRPFVGSVDTVEYDFDTRQRLTHPSCPDIIPFKSGS